RLRCAHEPRIAIPFKERQQDRRIVLSQGRATRSEESAAVDSTRHYVRGCAPMVGGKGGGSARGHARSKERSGPFRAWIVPRRLEEFCGRGERVPRIDSARAQERPGAPESGLDSGRSEKVRRGDGLLSDGAKA